MKKIIAMLMALTLVFAFAACQGETAVTTDDAVTTTEAPVETTEVPVETTEAPVETTEAPAEVKVMTYEEFVAADLDTEVTVETYIQATQSWWDNKITAYTQNEEGAYFLYEMACSEEDAAKLVPEWSGELEIVDATFEILEGNFVAEPTDVTALLGTDELIAHQNKLVSFKGMTFESLEYKNGEPGDDIYVTVSKDGNNYSFCVEYYLTGTDTDVYKAVQALTAGDVVDIDGFLYWYEGVNTHITAVAAAQ